MAIAVVAHSEPKVAAWLAAQVAAVGHDVSYCSSTATALVEAAVAEGPDIVFLDSSLVGVRCSTLTELASRSSAAIVVLGETGDPSTDQSLQSDVFVAGAAGYFSLAALPDALGHAMELLLGGALVIVAGPRQTSQTQRNSGEMAAQSMATREARANDQGVNPFMVVLRGVQTMVHQHEITAVCPRMPAWSVLIGHPSQLAQCGLSSILTQAGYEVIGQCATSEQLLAAATEYEPDIIIVQAGLLEGQPELVRRLTDLSRNVVVALSESAADHAAAINASVSGARGCLSIDDAPESFLASLQLLLSGSIVMSPGIRAHVHQRLDAPPEKPWLQQLTERERELVILIGEGATNSEIAVRLKISPNTVKTHVANVLSKLDLRNRQQIAAYAAHWLTDEDPSESARPD